MVRMLFPPDFKNTYKYAVLKMDLKKAEFDGKKH